jgi:nicotinamidase-related amidase
MNPRHKDLLDPKNTGLVVIDVQEKFRPAMADFETMLAGCIRLVRAFHILDLPVIATEQYPKGLGSTVSELRDVLGNTEVGEKTTFSVLGCPTVRPWLRETGVQTLLICGIETHVCVNQTVHDLLAADYRVHIATDALTSRKPTDHRTGLEKLIHAGALPTTTEMAAFELLGDARHAKFREVQALFK